MIRLIKEYGYWFLIIGVILLILFINTGCGKLVKETVTEENTVYSELTRREPYPIMREYTNNGKSINFTDETASIELIAIYYNSYDHATGSGEEDKLTMRVPVNSSGNVVTIQVRGKSYKWVCVDNLAHTVVFNIKPTPDTEWPDFRYLGITEDVLDAQNEYDFVRLFVNNVLYEMYYIADFALTE